MNELTGLFSGIKLEVDQKSQIEDKKYPNKLGEGITWVEFETEKNNQYALR